MIQATVSFRSCLCWLYRASPSLAAKNVINLILVLTIWWCPCIESSLVLLEEGFVTTSAFSWQNSISLCPASFRIPRPNLSVTPGVSWLPTFAFQSLIEFHLSYSKSWKMMLWKCCTQYASKFGKLSSGHRTGKGQFSFQPQRKEMPKNAQTTAQLHSSHMLVK